MSRKILITEDALTYTAVPFINLAAIVGFYLLYVWASLNAVDSEFEFIDHVIVHGVVLIVAAILQYKKTTFNKRTGEVFLLSRGLFNKSERTIRLADLTSIEMSYGHGGGNAKGGAIVIVTGRERITISPSDISPKSVYSNERDQQILADYVFSP